MLWMVFASSEPLRFCRHKWNAWFFYVQLVALCIYDFISGHRMAFSQSRWSACPSLWHRLVLDIRTCSRRPSALLPYSRWTTNAQTKWQLISYLSVCGHEYKWQHWAKRFTWMRPITPHESMRDATFTVLLHMSYCGFWAPITPASKPEAKRKRALVGGPQRNCRIPSPNPQT